MTQTASTSQAIALLRVTSGALLLTDQMGAPLSEALRPLTALVILTICFLVGSDLVSRFMTNADELTT